MADSPDRQIRIIMDINAYQDYIPVGWMEKTLAPIPKGTILEGFLLTLTLLWRTASYTAQMPATTAKATHSAAIGRGKYVTTDRSILGASDAILARLATKTTRIARDPALAARMRKALVEIAKEIRDELEAVKDDFPIGPVWEEHLKDKSFQLTLWSSQRIAYVAFYNAYEGFLVDVLKVGSDEKRLRSNDSKKFNEVLRTALSTDVQVGCWGDINIPRLIRHALSHNSGRVTEDLKGQPHKIHLIGDELQIVPDDIKRMLQRLRKAVDEIMKVTKDDPKFSAPRPLGG